MSGEPRLPDPEASSEALKPVKPKAKGKSQFASQAQRRIEELFSDLEEEIIEPEAAPKVQVVRAAAPTPQPARAKPPRPPAQKKPAPPSAPTPEAPAEQPIAPPEEPTLASAEPALEAPPLAPEAPEPEASPVSAPPPRPAATPAFTPADFPDQPQAQPYEAESAPGLTADAVRLELPELNLKAEEPAADITPAALLKLIDEDQDRRWSEDELSLVEQVSSQLKLALENALLFDQTQRARDALQISVRYQKSVAEAVAILSERGFVAISEVLQILGAAAQASRAYYLETQYDHTGPFWRLVFEWHAPGLDSQMANLALRRLPADELRDWVDQLYREGFRTASLSHSGIFDRQLLEALNVKSLLYFPIAGQQETSGCIGFEQADYERAWSSEEIAALQTAASALANTIARENLFKQLQVNLSETEAQYQASELLNSANSPAEILSILRQFTILGHINAANAAIYTFDAPWTRSSKPEYLLSTAGWSSSEAAAHTLDQISLGDWHNAEALLSPDRPGVVFDVASDPRLGESVRAVFAAQAKAKSLLCVPLNVTGRWIGEIIALYSQTTAFTEREVRRLVSLSGQAGVAVESLRLLDETRQRNEELLAMNQVTNAVSRTLELDLVLSEILQRVLALTEFHAGLISYVSSDTHQLTMTVHHNLPFEMVERLSERGMAGTTSDLVYRFGRTVHIPDLKDPPPEVLQMAHTLPEDWPYAGLEPAFHSLISAGFRSYLGVPLSAKGVELGTVCLYSAATMTVPPSRIALTEAIGQQVGVAVDNARLFQSTQDALGETEALYQASSELNSVQSYDEVLLSLRRYTLLGKTDKLLTLALFDRPWIIRGKERQTGRLPSLEDLKPPEWVNPIAHWSSLPLENRLGRYELRHFPAGNLLSHAEMTLIEEVAADERLDEDTRKLFLENFRANSVVFLPLTLGNQWIGLIFSAFSIPLEFDEMAVRRLMAIAGQSAIAIQNLRLLEESQRRASQLQIAAEIARDTSGTLALDNLLQRTVSQITERFGYYHASIFLIDETGTEAIVRESTGLAGEEMKRDGHRLVVGGRSLIGQVTGSGKSLVLNDVNTEEARQTHHPNPLLPFTRAELGIPLKIGAKVIGALDVQSDLVNAFSEDDIAVLQTLSDQIAVAVDNATSYELAQKAVEDIREADRLKTQFLANMSHELRTPLNSIIGFSRVILKGIDGPINEQQAQDLAAIYNSGQHLLGLINDVLDLSRIEAGKMDLAFEPNIKLAETIHSVMSTTAGLVKDKPIQLIEDIDPDLPLVTADLMKIRQVLINLLSNAAKFTDQGSITVQARPHQGPDGEPQVIVRVIDTGPGIAAQDQAKLFQPFSQVDGSLTRRTGGSGLGLSICSHLIQMHNGQIGLESEVGQGCTFYFTIPVNQAQWLQEGMELFDEKAAATPSAPAAEPSVLPVSEPAYEAAPTLEQAQQIENLEEAPAIAAPELESRLDEPPKPEGSEPTEEDRITTQKTYAPPASEAEDEPMIITADGEEFTLPLRPEGAQPQNADDEAGPFLVLAIEQDHKVIDLYKRYLAESNCTVISLTRLEQAVNVARGIQPFAITLDIAMAGSDRVAGTGPLLGPIYPKDAMGYLDGLKVLKDLKTDPGTRHIPVIVCSVLAEHEKAYKLGAADYLLKPILEEDLVQAIRRLKPSDP
ncbi:MAG: GAF domain-containing protein [Anaerolineales bacterium]|jgi:signal transduction histidine kinase/ActR/RegA family two-component response regulator|nr:GAF domain-containing protein [Anaerolineales bacterium]